MNHFVAISCLFIVLESQNTLLSGSFGDNMVLQREPLISHLFGAAVVSSVGISNGKISISVFSADVSYTLEATTGVNGTWKSFLKPQSAGGNFSVTVSFAYNASLTMKTAITNVTFGDVFFCSGQSNMWLPVQYTFERWNTMDKLKNGAYQNIRLFNVPKVEQEYPNFIIAQGAALWKFPTNSTVFGWSSTCWYFGIHLSEMIGDNIPIGLIHTGIGGSRIEQWMPIKSIAECKDLDQDGYDQGSLFYGMTSSFVNMTVKAVLWYQGENNVKECCDSRNPDGPIHCENLWPNASMTSKQYMGEMPERPLHRPGWGGPSACGNFLTKTGYACGISNLVKSWRQYWQAYSEELGFIIVTLAPATGEGAGVNLGSFRHAQMSSFNSAPNQALPNVIVTQAYDLGDPWPGHCSPTDPKHPAGPGCGPDAPWNPTDTPFYMGPIHPRVKSPLGNRMAKQAYNRWYTTTQSAPWQGPVMSGCYLNKEDHTLEVFFNKTLLMGEDVFMETLKPNTTTGIQIQTVGNLNKKEDIKGQWIYYNFVVEHSQNSILINLHPENHTDFTNTITGVRYAYVDNSCCPGLGENYPCPPESCPLKTTVSRLPANPFLAQVINGSCTCVPPAVCDQKIL